MTVSLTLLSWRREVAGLYAAVRADPDAERGWQHWREGRDRLFGDHPDSPLLPAARAEFDGLPVADYDPAYRFEVPLDRAEPADLDLPTASDGIVGLARIGSVSLAGLGTLDVWWLRGYGGGVFLPLRDGSAGATSGPGRSYGGGRYVLDTVKGADLGGANGRLVVDLNYAYHPSCAYNPEWSCPLAPEGNRLSGVVTAGEQLPPGGWYG